MPQARSTYDRKLEAILRGAAAVFAEKGYHRASIRDISRATGVSLSGLYYYFDSKEDLLFQIQDHCFATVLTNLERLLDGVEDPVRRLRLFVENHVRFFVNNMDEMKVMSHEAESLSGDYFERVNASKRRYTEICASIVEELSPPDGSIDRRVATFTLFGMMNWIYNWYHPGRDVPVTELAEDMSQLYLKGLLPGPETSLPASATDRVPGSSRPSIWRG
ncbi:MAG: TetR/AcrR family transcriptional regulator [Longimicrobiales bacterium]